MFENDLSFMEPYCLTCLVVPSSLGVWGLAVLQAVSVVEVLNNQGNWGDVCLCFPDFFNF